MTWDAAGETWLHLRDATGHWAAPRRLVDAGQPATLAWYSARRIVVLPAPRIVNGQPTLPREAIPFDPDDDTAELQPAGGFLPVRDLSEALFLQGVVLPPCYPISGNRHAALLPLSVASFAREGVARARVIDGGKEQSVWHRLCLEAVFPPGCGAIVELAASDDPGATPHEDDWHPHLFAEAPPPAPPRDDRPGSWLAPARGVWLEERSEIPHHAGLLGRAPEPGRCRALYRAHPAPRTPRSTARRALLAHARPAFRRGTSDTGDRRFTDLRLRVSPIVTSISPRFTAKTSSALTRMPWTTLPERIFSSVFWASSRAF